MLGLCLATAIAACKHNEGDSVVVTGEGVRLSSEAIDKDPLALLPANPVVLGWVDAQAFLGSQFGGEINRIAAKYLPVGQQTGFVPQRDLKKIVGGVYSLAGADFVIVAQGDFNADMIRTAADQHATTPGGVPLVHSKYAGNDLFTAGNVGFTVVTQHTMLVGNETGMRRALDRIRDNRLKREVPDWMTKLMDNPQASMVFAGDVTGQPQVAAMSKTVPFLNGLSNFRVLGNFQPPGINLAGTLSYPDRDQRGGRRERSAEPWPDGELDERARHRWAQLAAAKLAGQHPGQRRDVRHRHRRAKPHALARTAALEPWSGLAWRSFTISSSLRRHAHFRGVCRFFGSEDRRAGALCAALAEGESEIRWLSAGRDIETMMAALRSLGVTIEGDARKARVRGVGLSGLVPARDAIDCGFSTSVMASLAGVLVSRPFETVLSGDPSLLATDLAGLAGALRRRGGQIEGRFSAEHAGQITPPLVVGPLPAQVVLSEVDCDLAGAEPDIKCALLLSGLYSDGPTYVHERVVTRDHVVRLLGALDVPMATAGSVVELDPSEWSAKLPAFSCDVAGDFSAAMIFRRGGVDGGRQPRVHARRGTESDADGCRWIFVRSMGGAVDSEVHSVVLGETGGTACASFAPLRR